MYSWQIDDVLKAVPGIERNTIEAINAQLGYQVGHQAIRAVRFVVVLGIVLTFASVVLHKIVLVTAMFIAARFGSEFLRTVAEIIQAW